GEQLRRFVGKPHALEVVFRLAAYADTLMRVLDFPAVQTAMTAQPVDVVAFPPDDRGRSGWRLTARRVGLDQFAELRIAFVTIKACSRCEVPLHSPASRF